jgi:PTS system nitrogen regulatory IIA component
MKITDLLTARRVIVGGHARSKKRVLEALSEALVADRSAPGADQVFEGLLTRERLGSTALGKGVALPHARLATEQETWGAFLVLSEGVDFDALDNAPVDLFFALLVPERCTDEHLELLAQLTRMFNEARMRQDLRAATSAARVMELVARWEEKAS